MLVSRPCPGCNPASGVNLGATSLWLSCLSHTPVFSGGWLFRVPPGEADPSPMQPPPGATAKVPTCCVPSATCLLGIATLCSRPPPQELQNCQESGWFSSGFFFFLPRIALHGWEE